MVVLVWLFVKIPLILIALIAGLYLLYLKNMYDVVEAECIASNKNPENGKYQVVYRYLNINKNVIEQTEKDFEYNSPREVGEHYKILVNKKFPTMVKKYDKVIYGAWSVILIVAIIAFSL